MNTERIRWHDWDAIRCLTADLELIVGVSAGPRLLSLRRLGGPNLLHLDTTDLRVGEWRLYGGHRCSVAPEGPSSYTPDNEPCTTQASDRGLRVNAPIDASGLQRSLEIAPAREGTGFDLSHVLDNRGQKPWTGAIWAITCVPSSGPVVAPRGPGRLRFWPGTDRAPWEIGPDTLAVLANGNRGKAGWHSDPAWLASLQPNAALVIHAPQVSAPEACVDDGCNLEVFTGPNYLELETLGARVTLAAGSNSRHIQRWRILDPVYTVADWRSLAIDAGCT